MNTNFFMKSILLWLWQFPQNIIGAILARNYKNIKITDDNIIVYYVSNIFRSDVSLGNYILLDYDAYYGFNDTETIKHEHGHQIQSMIFGPLYLIIIGLPSACGNLIDRYFHKDWDEIDADKWYFSQPWEAWADKLGKVNRF